MVLLNAMRGVDIDRERSERKFSIQEFCDSYNENLPDAFPNASLPLLTAFKERYPELFKQGATWSLDQHRKKVMDWLPLHLRSTTP